MAPSSFGRRIDTLVFCGWAGLRNVVVTTGTAPRSRARLAPVEVARSPSRGAVTIAREGGSAAPNVAPFPNASGPGSHPANSPKEWPARRKGPFRAAGGQSFPTKSSSMASTWENPCGPAPAGSGGELNHGAVPGQFRCKWIIDPTGGGHQPKNNCRRPAAAAAEDMHSIPWTSATIPRLSVAGVEPADVHNMPGRTDRIATALASGTSASRRFSSPILPGLGHDEARSTRPAQSRLAIPVWRCSCPSHFATIH